MADFMPHSLNGVAELNIFEMNAPGFFTLFPNLKWNGLPPNTLSPSSSLMPMRRLSMRSTVSAYFFRHISTRSGWSATDFPRFSTKHPVLCASSCTWPRMGDSSDPKHRSEQGAPKPKAVAGHPSYVPEHVRMEPGMIERVVRILRELFHDAGRVVGSLVGVQREARIALV